MENPFLWLVIAVVFVVLALNGLLYQTGEQWYQSCWQKLYSTEGWQEPKPTTPEQAAAWNQCQLLAEKVTYDQGIIFTSYWSEKDLSTSKYKEVHLNCPSELEDVPSGGWYIFFVKAIEANGGVEFLDRIMPAENMLQRIVKLKWPHCATARKSLGFPKIIRKNGTWDWETPCIPCQNMK